MSPTYHYPSDEDMKRIRRELHMKGVTYKKAKGYVVLLGQEIYHRVSIWLHGQPMTAEYVPLLECEDLEPNGIEVVSISKKGK